MTNITTIIIDSSEEGQVSEGELSDMELGTPQGKHSSKAVLIAYLDGELDEAEPEELVDSPKESVNPPEVQEVPIACEIVDEVIENLLTDAAQETPDIEQHVTSGE